RRREARGLSNQGVPKVYPLTLALEAGGTWRRTPVWPASPRQVRQVPIAARRLARPLRQLLAQAFRRGGIAAFAQQPGQPCRGLGVERGDGERAAVPVLGGGRVAAGAVSFGQQHAKLGMPWAHPRGFVLVGRNPRNEQPALCWPSSPLLYWTSWPFERMASCALAADPRPPAPLRDCPIAVQADHSDARHLQTGLRPGRSDTCAGARPGPDPAPPRDRLSRWRAGAALSAAGPGGGFLRQLRLPSSDAP